MSGGFQNGIASISLSIITDFRRECRTPPPILLVILDHPPVLIRFTAGQLYACIVYICI